MRWAINFFLWLYPPQNPWGTVSQKKGSYVIQEWIDGENFFDKFLKSPGHSRPALSDHDGQKGSNVPTKEVLLDRLAKLLSMLKVHRIRHNDLHLNNIIVFDGTLFLVDLHKLHIKRSFGIDDEIANLTEALAMIYDNMDNEERDAFFQGYTGRDVRRQVEAAIVRLQTRWVRRKKERAFRETSMILRRGNRFYMVGTEGSGVGAFVGLIKKDRKVRIERYTDHIRKIYRDKRRLERAWRAHVVLAYMGLGIVPRAFYVEMPHGAAQGYIAMEDLKGTGEELDRYLDRRYNSMSENQKRLLEDKLSRYLLMLIRTKILHKDVKACNVFVPTDGDFMLLDVEDVRFRVLDEQTLKRMLIQLNTTIPKWVGTRARIRFFVKFTSTMKIDKRAVFSSIVKESLKREIVYEGVNGLVRETW